MKLCFLRIFLLFTFGIVSLNANEVKIYAQEKYNFQFDNQTEETQKKIEQEYQQNYKLFKILDATKMKNNPQIKVITQIATVQLWSNEFLNNYHPSQQELQELYIKTKLKLSERYKLSTIKVQYNASAIKIMKQLEKVKERQKKFEMFQDLVQKFSIDIKTKKNHGEIGWVEKQYLKYEVKKALEKSKQGDVIKVFIEDDGWQILYVQEHSVSQEATFAEAKMGLIKMAKQEALEKEIEKLLQ